MTYTQTLKAAHRALERLKVKRLISGPYIDQTRQVCCAAGALAVHVNDKSKVKTFPTLRCFFVLEHMNEDAVTHLVDVNENFRYGENSDLHMRARYKHVKQWIEGELSEREKRRKKAKNKP